MGRYILIVAIVAEFSVLPDCGTAASIAKVLFVVVWGYFWYCWSWAADRDRLNPT